MDGYVAVTDIEWYRFLLKQPDLDEVNFWQPSGGRTFKVLAPGEPLIFKLHYPENAIVGAGFFAHHTTLPVSLAWEAFGRKNGASSLEEMRARIAKYRHMLEDSSEDYAVGCILLQEPFFLDREAWVEPPRSFAKTTVQGKTYDLMKGEGRAMWDALQPVVQGAGLPVFGEPVLAQRRLGQGTFRAVVMDTYQRHCAVTGERILPVLVAAHVRPVKRGGDNRISNGILLRSDVHTLFDKGYLSVTPDYRLRASRRLKSDFDNGDFYLRKDGSEIWVPESRERRPSRDLLEWHNDTVFLR